MNRPFLGRGRGRGYLASSCKGWHGLLNLETCGYNILLQRVARTGCHDTHSVLCSALCTGLTPFALGKASMLAGCCRPERKPCVGVKGEHK